MDVLPATAEQRPPSRPREKLDDFAARGAFSRFLVLAVPSGLLFGLFTGVRELSLSAGVAAGAFFAVFFGVTMTVLIESRLRVLRSLTPNERREVMRAVRRGTAVSSVRLAQGVVAYTQVVRRGQWREPSTRRLNIGFVVLGVLVLLGALPRHRPSEVVVDVVIFVLLLRMALKAPERRARVLLNAAAADGAARTLLTSAATAPGNGT